MERLRGHEEGGEGEGKEDAGDEISAEGNAKGEGEGKGEGGPTTAASAGSEAEETAGQGRSCISEEEVGPTTAEPDHETDGSRTEGTDQSVRAYRADHRVWRPLLAMCAV